MHELYDLKDRLCKELKEYGRQESVSLNTLDVIDKLSRSVKNLDKIIKGSETENYSQRGGYSRDSYSDGYSERRYMRDGGSNSMRGYSGHGSDMIHQLREMMNNAPDEQTRSEMRQMIERMEQMQ